MKEKGNELIREKLAELCHKQWSGWMEYLFEKCSRVTFTESWKNIDNTESFDRKEYDAVIPGWAIERWQRQMNIDYKDLSEEEKESDRKEADRILEALASLGVAINNDL